MKTKNESKKEYNKNNQLIKETIYYSDNKTIKCIIEHNPTTNQTKEIFYNKNNQINHIEEYDQNSNQTKEIQYRENGTINYIKEIHPELDVANFHKIIYYDKNNVISKIIEHEYADSSTPTKTTTYDKNNNIKSIIEYDEYGNKIQRKQTN